MNLLALQLLVACIGCVVARKPNPLAFNGPEFTSTTKIFTGFKSEPTFQCEDFDIQRIPKNRSLLAPGYIFMNAMIKSPDYGYGLSIYTQDGELIWRGFQEKLAQNLHVCDFAGSKGAHLCFYTRWTKHRIPNLPEPGVRKSTYGRLMILDATYNQTMMFEAGFDDLSINGHAFETHDNGYSATTIVARPRVIDLSRYGGNEKHWILNQCIQEWQLPSGNESFHWCYYESGLSVWQSRHISHIKDEWAQIGGAWDFLHTNAVAKNSDGDYLISMRHADTVLKIAGRHNPNGIKPGDLIWRLGGKSNNFSMRGFDTEQGFTKQHDVQALEINGKKEVISLLNNAWDRWYPPSQSYSEGQVISIDTESMEATRVHNYPHPLKSLGRHESLSDGRGSMQQLPNGNALLGWGVLPEFTEYSKNGGTLYHVKYSRKGYGARQFSYRVYRSPWIGKPHWSPKLVAYSQDCAKNSPLTAYVSHNGATEITNWRFSAAISENGPWKLVGSSPKDGFETKANLEKVFDFVPYVLAEALDANDVVLGIVVEKTFVPSRKDRVNDHCGRTSCKRHFVYSREKSIARECYSSEMRPPNLLTIQSASIQRTTSGVWKPAETSLGTIPIGIALDETLSIPPSPADSAIRTYSTKVTTYEPIATKASSAKNSPSKTGFTAKKPTNSASPYFSETDSSSTFTVSSFTALAAIFASIEVFIWTLHTLTLLSSPSYYMAIGQGES